MTKKIAITAKDQAEFEEEMMTAKLANQLLPIEISLSWDEYESIIDMINEHITEEYGYPLDSSVLVRDYRINELVKKSLVDTIKEDLLDFIDYALEREWKSYCPHIVKLAIVNAKLARQVEKQKRQEEELRINAAMTDAMTESCYCLVAKEYEKEAIWLAQRFKVTPDRLAELEIYSILDSNKTHYRIFVNETDMDNFKVVLRMAKIDVMEN